MSRETVENTLQKRLLTIREAACYLGVAEWTLYRWVCKRHISFVKLRTKAVRFDKAVLDRWIDGQTVRTAQEVRNDGHLQARRGMVVHVLSRRTPTL